MSPKERMYRHAYRGSAAVGARGSQHTGALIGLAVMAAVVIFACGGFGCAAGPTELDLPSAFTARVGGLPDKTSDPCARVFILNPPEMAGYSGLWLQSVAAGSPGDCEMENFPFPQWSINPGSAKLATYHRPHDVSNNDPDPAGYGNWARISLVPGTYMVETENGMGSYTTIQVVIP